MAFSAVAQDVLTLQAAIQKGLSNKNNIKAGKADLNIRTLQTKALFRKYWPTVDFEYNYLYNPILQTSILPIGVFNPTYPPDATKSVQFGTKWSQTAGLSANLPLIDLSIGRQINEAKYQERIAAAAQAQTEYDLTYTIAQTYIDIIIQENRIKTAVADTNRTWVSFQLLQNKFAQKRLLKSDLNKALINHNNTVQQLRAALSQLIEDRVYLLFLIGANETAQPDIAIDTSFINDKRLPKVNLLQTSTIPEVQQLELNSKITSIQTKSEKAKYLPVLSIKGYLGANQFANRFDPIAHNTWFGLSRIGIDLKYPVISGEDKQRKLEQIRLQGVKYDLQREDKSKQYSKDGTVSKLKMDLLLSQLTTQEANLTLSNQSLIIMQDRVAEGQETASSLNTEEANLQSQVADYQTSKKQYWQQYLDYLRATGNLKLLSE